MRPKLLKKTLYIFFIFSLSLPLFQLLVPLVKVMPLKGAVDKANSPIFTSKDWFSSNFQTQFENYIGDNIGFRPWMVRVHNQAQYTFFKKAKARGVIRGKGDYLYELNYIKAYNGDDFIGGDTIKNKVKDLQQLQDKLKKLNKTLFVCIAPGKGQFYHEFIPDDMLKPASDSTNYKQYIKYLNQYGVNHIDVNQWFLELKDTCECILYPKYGIHWSYYGMLLAADSISRFIGEFRNITMPHLEISEIELSSHLKYTDYDIGEGMNLMFQMPSEPMCYPKFSWNEDAQTVKPKGLVISDSFYWSMFNNGMGSKNFSLGGFWYYNKQIFPESFDDPLNIDQVNIKQRILDNDVILLMSTDANLSKFSWGFVEEANKILSDPDCKFTVKLDTVNISELNSIITSIKNNTELYRSIKKKAKKKNISVDSMLVLDARWIIENRNQE